MSTFKCEVVPVKLEPHPNADTLSIVKVWGYTVVVKTTDWEGLADRGLYIPPDSLVPLGSPMFSFLPKSRITVKRFRGVYSQGLLIPMMGHEIGSDLSEYFGVTHYEPEIKYDTQGNRKDSHPPVPGPPGMVIPKYDVEHFNRYAPCIPDGTPVYVTEKIHGANARFVYANPNPGRNPEVEQTQAYRMYAGSRTTWKHDGSAVEGRNTEYVPTDPWWNCLRQNPWIGRVQLKIISNRYLEKS